MNVERVQEFMQRVEDAPTGIEKIKVATELYRALNKHHAEPVLHDFLTGLASQLRAEGLRHEDTKQALDGIQSYMPRLSHNQYVQLISVVNHLSEEYNVKQLAFLELNREMMAWEEKLDS